MLLLLLLKMMPACLLRGSCTLSVHYFIPTKCFLYTFLVAIFVLFFLLLACHLTSLLLLLLYHKYRELLDLLCFFFLSRLWELYVPIRGGGGREGKIWCPTHCC